jgi:hypothetical protein
VKEQQMTEPDPDECPVNEHIPDYDFPNEPDAAALAAALDDVGDSES